MPSNAPVSRAPWRRRSIGSAAGCWHFATPVLRSRAVADELQALRREGAEILVVAGASALDPLDPVFGGLALLGASMERHGAPAHPGSLLWLARWDRLPVLGMPTCGMFSQATTFDLVLPRILAGEAMGNREIAAPRPRRPPLARDGVPLPAVPRQRRARRARVSRRPAGRALQRRHPGALAAAALPRGAAGCDRGGRGRQSALRRSRADDGARAATARSPPPASPATPARSARRRPTWSAESIEGKSRRRGHQADERGRADDACRPTFGPTRLRCVTLPLTVLQQALQPWNHVAMRMDEQTRGDFPILDPDRQRPPARRTSTRRPRARSRARCWRRWPSTTRRATPTCTARSTRWAKRRRSCTRRRATGSSASSARPAARKSSSRAERPTGSTWWPRRWARTLRPGDEILITDMEHHSNIIPWQMAARDRGACECGRFPLTGDGLLDLDGVRADARASARRWWPSPTCRTCWARSRPVAQLCRRARAAGAVTVVDGAQAAPHLPLDMSALGCDLYVFSSHKMLGPDRHWRPVGPARGAGRARAHARRRRDDQGGLDRSGPVERSAVAFRAGHARRSPRPWGSWRRSSISRSSGWSGWPSTRRRWPGDRRAAGAIPGVTVYGPQADVDARRGRGVQRRGPAPPRRRRAARSARASPCGRATTARSRSCAGRRRRHRARELLGLQLVGGGRALGARAGGVAYAALARHAPPVRATPSSRRGSVSSPRSCSCRRPTTPAGLDVALLGLPYDGGVSYRPGARFGPRAVREQSSLIRPWNPVLKVHPFEKLRVADCGDVDVVPISIERTHAAIEREDRLGHGGRGPAAVRRRRSLGHAAGHPRAGPTPRAAGRRALRRAPRHVGPVLRQQALPRHAVPAGHRGGRDRSQADDPGRHPRAALRLRGLRLPRRARHRGAADRADQGAGAGVGDRAGSARLRGMPLYCSFDIDAVDPAYAPATGTPEVGGLSSWEALTPGALAGGHHAGGRRHRGGLAAVRRARTDHLAAGRQPGLRDPQRDGARAMRRRPALGAGARGRAGHADAAPRAGSRRGAWRRSRSTA